MLLCDIFSVILFMKFTSQENKASLLPVQTTLVFLLKSQLPVLSHGDLLNCTSRFDGCLLLLYPVIILGLLTYVHLFTSLLF